MQIRHSVNKRHDLLMLCNSRDFCFIAVTFRILAHLYTWCTLCFSASNDQSGLPMITFGHSATGEQTWSFQTNVQRQQLCVCGVCVPPCEAMAANLGQRSLRF